DDAAIGKVAAAAGATVIGRPAELATDTASTESALLHALKAPAVAALAASWVMTLPPTSPLRDAAAIRSFLAAADRSASVDCYFSVSESRGDFWRVAETGWTRLFPDAPRRQQDREPLFEENSAI